MTDDEIVNGPNVAAKILARMEPEARARLLNSIKEKDPKLAIAISSNIVTYEDIAVLTPQSIQLLIKEVAHRDLVISLKIASEAVKKAIFANMSERKRVVTQDDLASLPPMKLAEIEESQKKVVAKFEELRTAGLIRSNAADDELV